MNLFPRLLLCGVISLLSTSSASGAVFTWDGNSPNAGAGDNNISTALNWAPDGAPLSDLVNTDLIFAGTTKLAPNFSTTFSADSLTINNTSGIFTFGGQTLTIGAGGITNSDAQGQIFTNAVTLGTISSFNATNGGLTFNGALNLGTNTLLLNGANAFSFGSAITGAGTITKNGAGGLNLSATASSIGADLNLSLGTTTLLATGTTQTFTSASTVATTATAALALNENVILDGAQLTRASTATLTLGAGKTFTMQNGGAVTIDGAFTLAQAANLIVTGVSSILSTTGALNLSGGSTTNIAAGGGVTSGAGAFTIGSTTDGTVTVNGIGSSVTGGTLTVGRTGGGGSLTFSSGSTGAFGGIVVDGTSTTGTSGALRIEGGASVSGTNLIMANITVVSSGSIVIDGANSALTLSGNGSNTIGATASNTGTLTAQNGGVFTANSGTLVVQETGTIGINGGTFNARGDLFLRGQMTRDSAGVFNLAAGKTLTIQGGGDATFNGLYFHETASSISVTGVGSTFGASDALSLSGGSTTTISAGGRVSSNSLGVGFGSNGTVTVDGAGSSLVGNLAFLGDPPSGFLNVGNAGAGSLTFRNSSTGSFLSIGVGGGTAAGTSGTLNIESGAAVTASSLNLAVSAGVFGALPTGAVVVTGPNSSLTLSGSAIIGANSLSTGTLTVQSGAVFTTGGFQATMVNPTGFIDVNGGTYNVNGGLTINGGRFAGNGPNALNLGVGLTLTVQNGGDAGFAGDFRKTTRGNLEISGNGSTFTTGGDFQWEGGNSTLAFLDVTDGGLLSAGNALHLGRNDTAVSLRVSGAGSQIRAGLSSTSEWQAGVILSSGATATLGGLRLADVVFGGPTSASLDVQSGSTASLGNLAAGSLVTDATATITVDGPGSQITQTGASTLQLGAAFATSTALSVTNGGVFTSGTGAITLNATSTVNINGGALNLNGPITDNGGTVNFTSGALNIVSPLTIGQGGLLGDGDVALAANRLLTTTAATTIAPFATLTLDGGTLRSGSLTNNGTVAFKSGTLAITGAGGFAIGSGALGSSLTLGPGANFQVASTATVASGALLRVDGGSFSCSDVTNAGTIDHRDGALGFTGTLTNTASGRIFIGGLASPAGAIANAGRITMEDGLGFLGGAGALTNTGVITGDGTIAKPVTNSAGGQIRGSAGGTLTFTGAFGSNAGTISLAEGTLEFSGPVTNATNGFISGRGSLHTGGLTNNGVMAFSGGNADIFGDVVNAGGARIATSGAGATTTFYDDVVHNGTEIFTGPGGSTVFFGEQSGAGSFTGSGTVYYIGDLRPGNSPAGIHYDGDVIFGSTAILSLEIAGLSAGTAYDQLRVRGKLFAAGSLRVTLLDGFTPQMGNTFDFFDAGSIDGSFAAVTLPELGAGLSWETSRLASLGEVAVVPEPGSMVLILAGGAFLALRRRVSERA